MNRADLVAYLSAKPEAQACYPFGPDVQVFKVKGKMFALLSNYLQRDSINLKSDPQAAQELRDIFTDVIPGYYMNKRHWNTLFFDGEIPEGEVKRQVDCSYALVVKGLTRSQRQALELSYGPDTIYQGLL